MREMAKRLFRGSLPACPILQHFLSRPRQKMLEGATREGFMEVDKAVCFVTCGKRRE